MVMSMLSPTTIGYALVGMYIRYFFKKVKLIYEKICFKFSCIETQNQNNYKTRTDSKLKKNKNNKLLCANE
jgi:hypothetical protein